MFQLRPQVETRPTDPWTKYHYAILTTHGVHMLFDTLRYEHAFICRSADMEAIRHVMKGLEHTFITLKVLICKYSEGRHGNWTLGRLLSTMTLDEIDIAEVIRLDSEFSSPKPVSRLKYLNEVTVTAKIADVLDMMLKNHAMPASEGDAHIIERVPYNPDEPITVRLKNYSAVAGAWQFCGEVS